MIRILFFATILLLSGCQTPPSIIQFEVLPCNSEMLLGDKKFKDRLLSKEWKNEVLFLEIFFVEHCGFQIHPELQQQGDSLIIFGDFEKYQTRFDPDVDLGTAMCDCCFVLKLEIKGIEEQEYPNLQYFWVNETWFPKKILPSKNQYQTFSIDFDIIGLDTIFYPKSEDGIYHPRYYYLETDSTTTFALHPDDEDLWYKIIYHNPSNKIDGKEIIYGKYYTYNKAWQIVEEKPIRYLEASVDSLPLKGYRIVIQ